MRTLLLAPGLLAPLAQMPITRKQIEGIPEGHRCRWPYGDPRMQDFHWCDKRAEPGKPYCLDHCNIAYVGDWRAARAVAFIPT
jgi:hypothetical protein